MDKQRYHLLDVKREGDLTLAEIEDGWHFCCEWDYMLIHPSMPEAECCSCAKVKTTPPQESQQQKEDL